MIWNQDSLLFVSVQALLEEEYPKFHLRHFGMHWAICRYSKNGDWESVFSVDFLDDCILGCKVRQFTLETFWSVLREELECYEK